MKYFLGFALLATFLVGCSDSLILDAPEFKNGGILSQTKPLPDSSPSRLNGVWVVEAGQEQFGDSVVVKVSGDRVTVFARPNVGYIILQAGYLDSVVFLEGYWREQVNAKTGLARFVVPKENGGGFVVTGGIQPDTMRIAGVIGDGQDNPDKNFQLRWVRDFSAKANEQFFNIAHRAGGRTADRLLYSENTVELIKIAEHYGSNAVEIDVRLSSDNIPYLYHDNEINPRLVQRGALVGPSENYPYSVLRQYATLIRGEHIPTFQEALDAIVYDTDLEFVYLDTKTPNAGLISIMIPMMQKAKADADAIPGRKELNLYIGLPTQDTYDEFKSIPGHENVASLCELSIDQTREIDANVWGPRWTLGTQNDLVSQAHAEGRLAVTWTLDIDEFIEEFIRTGQFNGILTNYPTLVTYHRYMQ